MVFCNRLSRRSSLGLAALALSGGLALAAPEEAARPPEPAPPTPVAQAPVPQAPLARTPPAEAPATRPPIPSSDASAPAAQVQDARPPGADPVAADALKLEPVKGEAAGEQASDALPRAASAYASTDPEGMAFPTPDAAVSPAVSPALSPAAPVPELPDPARSALARDLAGDVDLTALRQGIDLYRRGKFAEGDRLRDGFQDPAARALLEWVAIRAGTGVDLDRILAFLRANPDWPAGPLVRRRAEERLLAEKKGAAYVRTYFAAARPETAPGKLALALAFRVDGLEADAADLVRDLWRRDEFGRSFEARVLEAFPDTLTPIDHRTRMERALLKEDWDTAGRAAAYAGGSYASLVRARRAVEAKSSGAPQALNAVPPSLRNDSSFMLSRAQYYRRTEKFAEAAKILAAAPVNPEVLVDGDEWWVERRIVARKLIDQGDPKTAYAVVSGHSARSSEKQVEAEFHAGWVALRFSADPKAAAGHFAKAAGIAETPTSIARAAYWQGRAADQVGETAQARTFYERAAAQPIAYYGQLARAKLGQTSLALRQAAVLDEKARAAFDARAFVRGLKLLAAVSVKDLGLALYIDAAKVLPEAELNALGEVALQTRDARALVALGKTATGRGLALDIHAFPVNGIPDYETFTAVPQVERAMVFAIARQESQFDPLAQSGVGARGLMQMMPATAQRTAKRVGASFELGRLTGDPAFCARLGQAHLGELMLDWRGSYILAFAAYNAGGGNVKKWIEAYGDPRKGEVDPIDWVERIPFTETRNYVQRVMENLQVYRNRLTGRTALAIDGDFSRGAPGSVAAAAAP